jgi:hypothetical protein
VKIELCHGWLLPLVITARQEKSARDRWLQAARQFKNDHSGKSGKGRKGVLPRKWGWADLLIDLTAAPSTDYPFAARRIAMGQSPQPPFEMRYSGPTLADAGDTGHSVKLQHTLELKTLMTNHEGRLNGKR